MLTEEKRFIDIEKIKSNQNNLDNRLKLLKNNMTDFILDFNTYKEELELIKNVLKATNEKQTFIISYVQGLIYRLVKPKEEMEILHAGIETVNREVKGLIKQLEGAGGNPRNKCTMMQSDLSEQEADTYCNSYLNEHGNCYGCNYYKKEPTTESRDKVRIEFIKPTTDASKFGEWTLPIIKKSIEGAKDIQNRDFIEIWSECPNCGKLVCAFHKDYKEEFVKLFDEKQIKFLKWDICKDCSNFLHEDDYRYDNILLGWCGAQNSDCIICNILKLYEKWQKE